MSKTIVQKIAFKNTTPGELFELYMNAKKHSDITNSDAIISEKEGVAFSAYGEYITGKNLQIIKNRLVVQSWRASDWNDEDIDSTFILQFEEKGKDVILYVTHANVPDREFENLKQGWIDNYWNFWKEYLQHPR